MEENRRLWQVAKDLPLGTAHLVEIIYEAIQGYCSNCKHYLTLIPPGIDHQSQSKGTFVPNVPFGRHCESLPNN